VRDPVSNKCCDDERGRQADGPRRAPAVRRSKVEAHRNGQRQRDSASAPREYRGATLVLAGLVPFLAIGRSGLVENYQPLASAAIDSLAARARDATPQEAVFLFPNARKNVSHAVFRARAQRALYVDWKGGGQVNYLPDFAFEWWKRWEETREGRWNVKAANLRRIAAMGVDYVVVPAERPIPGVEPSFLNQRFLAYRTRTGE
jgi:hypothetical protein